MPNPPPFPQIPSRVGSRGVGTGSVFVGSRNRYGYGEQEDPTDRNLRRLAEIDRIDQEGQTSDVQRNAALMNMAKEYYGIQSEQQLTPAHVALLKAQADYYGTKDEEKPEERSARTLDLKLSGLARAYYGREQSPEYQQAVRNTLTDAGYNFNTPAPTAKPEAFNSGDVSKGVTQPNLMQRSVGASEGYAAPDYGFGANPKPSSGPASLGDLLTVNNPQLKKPNPTGINWIPAYLQ